MVKNKKLIVGWHYVRTCIRWCMYSIATGIACGLVGSGLYYLVVQANEVRMANPWLIYLLPIAGLIIVRFYIMLDLAEDRGPDLIFDSIREENHVPIQVIVTSMISTVITHLFGGSSGRVGAALQIGGGVSSGLSKYFKLDSRDRSLFIMCGMGGLVSVLFGTPLAAAFLAMEVISIGVIYYAAFLPCIVTSITAFIVSEYLGVASMRFEIPTLSAKTGMNFVKVGILAVGCAVVSILFCIAIKQLNVFLTKWCPNRYIRVVLGAVAVVVLTVLVKEQVYNGSGNALLNSALGGETVKPYDFVLKLIFTAITLACGFKGGGIFPAFIVGATFGSFVGPYIGLSPSFAGAIGMVSVFCGAVNCPIASVLLSVEVFGGESVIFFAIACAISFVLSGYSTLFPGQEFIYSKIRMEYKASGLRED